MAFEGDRETATSRDLKDATKYYDRVPTITKLVKRYNLEGLLPVPKSVFLPFSKAKVTVPCIDVKAAIVALLVDPRFKAEDYLFFDDDPLAPPPEQVTWIKDLNTGDAHLKTHKKLITDPQRQVLLPLVLCIDGATTGNFSALPVTALKVALGIHTRTTRDKPFAWKELAYIPQVRKHRARGKKLFKESGHLDSQDVVVMDGEGDSGEEGSNASGSSSDEALEGAPKAQDLHTMLRVALKGLVELQKTGFIWDLQCKNKTCKDIEFIPCVSFVKCDTEEGDLLCGKYLVRTGTVAHLCRYCHCPTAQADNPHANFKLKTQAEIERLIERKDLEGLQAISQQCLRNAFYSVRFHQANKCGIHGATPSEMLHALLLGIFKYCCLILFAIMGKDSLLAQDFDGLATMCGKMMARQSDRDLPQTNFRKGIRRGTFMAKQFRGILLNIAAVLASTDGRKRLLKKKKFGGERGLDDWQMLIELLLEWEAYLNEKEMKRTHVQRLAKKNRVIMYFIKKVAPRDAGMGLKLMKFHAIAHLVNDILLHGVPSEFDTGSNESHHKPTKQAAQLTQRDKRTFDMQTAIRLIEFLAIDLAMWEIEQDEAPWDYFILHHHDPTDNAHAQGGEASRNMIGGTRIEVFLDEERDNEPSFRVLGKSKHAEKTELIPDALEFLIDLQDLIGTRLQIYTEHNREGVMFRAHPNYRGTGPWKDWVIVDWGQHGNLPSRIWCFVELIGLPTGQNALEFGGIRLKDGICAMVETTTYDEVPDGYRSDIFVPLRLDMDETDPESPKRIFYLADAEAFVEPCAVVPDIGGPLNRYFLVRSRSKWVKSFVNWLEAPHHLDVMEDSNPE